MGRRHGGDGINDAPALAQADVRIAILAGTDVAIAASDNPTRGELNAAVAAIRLSRRAMAIFRQNLFWAFACNVLGLSIGAGVLYPFFGVLSASSSPAPRWRSAPVSVILNTLRLRGYDPADG